MTDLARDRLIEAYRNIVELAKEREWKYLAGVRMASLIAERSRQQVERAKGTS